MTIRQAKDADVTVDPTGRDFHIWADRPIVSPSEDRFGFLPYADAFALLINDRATSTPLTVAISGPWGSGKTSLAKLLESRLKVERYWQLDWAKPPITCWFNAWMHGDAPNLGAALAASVSRDVSAQRPRYWRLLSPLPSAMLSPERKAWRRLGVVVGGASLIFVLFMGILWIFPHLRNSYGKLDLLFERWKVLTVYAAAPAVIVLFRNFLKVSGSVGTFIDAPRSAAAQGTIAEVRDQIGRIMRQAQRSGHRAGRRAKRRVVIFVDDLERCPANKALDMCEVISQLLGHENVVTVLVADLDLLETAATVKYRLTREISPSARDYSDVGQEYLHKLIQLRFNLPPLDPKDISSALGLAGLPSST